MFIKNEIIFSFTLDVQTLINKGKCEKKAMKGQRKKNLNNPKRK